MLEPIIAAIKADKRITCAGYALHGESDLCGHETKTSWKRARLSILLPSADTILQLKDAGEFVSRLRPSDRINRRIGDSYTLKHLAESALDTYISNGCLIAALIAAGFRPSGEGNPHFNITTESLEAACNRDLHPVR